MLCAFQGKCDHCGHDHGNPFDLHTMTALQSENERLRAQVESMLAVNQVMRDALQEITTLHGSTMNFSVARCMAENGLKLKPSDVELVEVGTHTVHKSSCRAVSAINDTLLPDGKSKLYILKQKEGV